MHVDWETFTDSTKESAEVRLLGLADLASVVLLQKLMVHEVRQQNRTSACVLICEHPPVITRGQSTSLLELPTDKRELQSRSLDVVTVPREGGALCHLPGRLSAYIVVSLAERDYGFNEFRWRLQDAVIATCAESKVKAFRKDNDPNALWARQGILCEFGIGQQDGVTSFGLNLNVCCELEPLNTAGRGLKGERFSSLNKERHRLTSMAVVRTELIRNICEQIGYPEYHMYTGHPFLTRRQRVV